MTKAMSSSWNRGTSSCLICCHLNPSTEGKQSSASTSSRIPSRLCFRSFVRVTCRVRHSEHQPVRWGLASVTLVRGLLLSEILGGFV